MIMENFSLIFPTSIPFDRLENLDGIKKIHHVKPNFILDYQNWLLLSFFLFVLRNSISMFRHIFWRDLTIVCMSKSSGMVLQLGEGVREEGRGLFF